MPPKPPAPAPSGGSPASGGAELEFNQFFESRMSLLKTVHSMGGDVLKEIEAPGGTTFQLALVKCPNGFQVLLHSASKATAKLETGTFMGRGGPGKFMAAEGLVLEPRASPHSWVYTRLTSYNKDIPSRANGCLVLERQGTQPSLATLEQVEQVLGHQATTVYGHTVTRGARTVRVAPGPTKVVWTPLLNESHDVSTFTVDNLGHWAQSREEETSTGWEIKGFLRCAFAMEVKEGGLSPNQGGSLCLFTRKQISLKADQWLVL